MSEVVSNKLKKIRETICMLLLIIWCIIPILKEIRITCTFVIINEYCFIKIVGVIGLVFLILDIYSKTIIIKNNKTYDMEILPISLLGCFMIWTLISSLRASNINYAFLGTEYRKDGYITYLAYAAFFSLAFFVKSNKNRKIIINTFVIIAIVNILLVRLYELGIGIKILAVRETENTCFFNSNHYGYYLMLATVSANFLFITEKNKYIKIIYLLAYSYLLYYIMINNTFGCYLAIMLVLIMFLIYTIYKREKRVVALISIIVFILMIFSGQQVRIIVGKNIKSLYKDITNIAVAEKIKHSSIENEEKEEALIRAESGGSGRIKLWKYGIKFFLEKPILGYGPENLEERYNELGIKQDRPHNLLIQLATTSGIIGLLIYIVAIFIILIRALKIFKFKNSIHVIVIFNVIAYLISAMFGNSMYYTSPYFFIFLGFLMRENINLKNELNNE